LPFKCDLQRYNAERRGALAAAAASPSSARRFVGSAALRARHFAVDYAQGGGVYFTPLSTLFYALPCSYHIPGYKLNSV
jgi:hypothetical protein